MPQNNQGRPQVEQYGPPETWFARNNRLFSQYTGLPMDGPPVMMFGSGGLSNAPQNSLIAAARGVQGNVIRQLPTLPDRPFHLDYKGNLSNPGSALSVDMEGRPIVAQYVAGRQVQGGPDVALSGEAISDLANTLTNNRPAIAPKSELPNSMGTFRRWQDDSQPATQSQIAIRDNLTPSESENVMAHEVGHALDFNGRGLSMVGNLDASAGRSSVQQRQVYGAQNQTVDARPRPLQPADLGYSQSAVEPELNAESIRAYIQNPGWMKQNAPDLARKIRAQFNSNPATNQQVQFNSAAAFATGAAGSGFGLLSGLHINDD